MNTEVSVSGAISSRQLEFMIDEQELTNLTKVISFVTWPPFCLASASVIKRWPSDKQIIFVRSVNYLAHQIQFINSNCLEEVASERPQFSSQDVL